MIGVVKWRQKSKHSNPQEPNQAEAGAVVAKATVRGLVFENNPSAAAAGWSAVDCKLTLFLTSYSANLCPVIWLFC